MQLTLYSVKCKRETISLSFLLFAWFIPSTGLMLLDATHSLYNRVTVQFSTVFYSSHRKELMIEYTSSHGWEWQECAGFNSMRLSLVFLFVGLAEHSFLQGSMYNHTLSVCPSGQGFAFSFFWPCDIFVATAWKKKEWVCSMLWFYHNSSSRVAITHFLHLGLCFSTSVIFIQAGFSQLFHMLIRQLMIEMEPLTFTIVVHSKSKAKGFKYYQRCIIKNVSCLCWQSASVAFQSLGRVRPLVPLKQWCKGLS